MQENKIDKVIREKLENRSIEPSLSAWERLEYALDDAKKKDKSKIHNLLGVAASVILIFSVFTYVNSNNEEVSIPTKIEIVSENNNQILSKDTIKIKDNVFEQKIIHQKAIVSKSNIKKIKKQVENKLAEEKIIIDKVLPKEVMVAKTVIQSERKSGNETTVIKNRRITINSEDLLYAVTHSSKEVQQYYANLNLKRDDVLDTIKKQLGTSYRNIRPETILAEVERSIEEDELQGDFMQDLKLKISNIIVAIADRNK